MIKGTRTLYSWGSVPWATVQEIIGDAPTAWADYDGFHIGDFPSEAPPYSHLWAWSAKSYFRVRIDGDEGIIAALGTGDLRPDTAALSESREVLTHEYEGISWGNDGQISPKSAALIATISRITLVETIEPMPMTFVSVTMAP